ncbi:4-hydroxy-tetrahydrodipicolinate reductase [Bienertia sinuspersici]
MLSGLLAIAHRVALESFGRRRWWTLRYLLLVKSHLWRHFTRRGKMEIHGSVWVAYVGGHSSGVDRGDFNEILTMDEKEGGSDRHRREMEKFRKVLDNCELRDLGFEGQWWTWERGKSADNWVRERLDRFMASIGWCNFFPNAQVEHQLKHCSGHAPILLRTILKKRKKHRRTKRFRMVAR